MHDEFWNLESVKRQIALWRNCNSAILVKCASANLFAHQEALVFQSIENVAGFWWCNDEFQDLTKLHRGHSVPQLTNQKLHPACSSAGAPQRPEPASSSGAPQRVVRLPNWLKIMVEEPDYSTCKLIRGPSTGSQVPQLTWSCGWGTWLLNGPLF